MEAQEAAIRDACERKGLVLVDIVKDAGVSGNAERKPGREYAIQRIEAGEAQALIVSKLDRVSRSVVDFGMLLKQALDNKWSLIMLDPDVDTTTPTGKAVAGIMAVMAEWERDMISQRTREGLAAAKARGVQIGKPSSLSSEMRQQIIKLRTEKKWTLQQIADWLTETGVPTSKGGAKWYPSAVRHIVTGEWG